MLSIAKRLLQLRTERGMTHKQISEAVGITIGQVSRLENGSTPSAPTMKRLADLFGVTMDDLLDDNASSKPSELENKLIDAAQRAQRGDSAALVEMHRLAARLGVADAARAKAAASSGDEPRKKRGT